MTLPRFSETWGQDTKQSTIVQDQELVDQPTLSQNEHDKEAQAVTIGLDNSSANSYQDDPTMTLPPVPLQMKLLSVLLVSCIGFGSQWSSGVSSAMKSTIKKVCLTLQSNVLSRVGRKSNAQQKQLHINNTQFSLLEASEDFMSSALILLTGIFTDRLGGTGCIVYGNIIYTIGSILIAGAAETRSYKFMIVGRVVASFGDIATQVAQYKVFSSWFPPNAGFASTLGFELGIKKVCGRAA